MKGSQKALAVCFLTGVAAVLWYHVLVFQAAGGTPLGFGGFLLWVCPYLPLSVLLILVSEGLDGLFAFVVPVIQMIVYGFVIRRAQGSGRFIRGLISLAAVHSLALVAVLALRFLTPWR